MIPFIIYDDTGRILRCGNCAEFDFEHQAGPNENIMERSANPANQFIENGLVVNMPSKPGDNYVFDYTSKTWQPDLALAASSAIAKRSKLLAEGPDRVNPIWWAAMSATEQAEVANYRQALLDITNQSGYPMDIAWPEIPSVFKG